MEPSPNSPFLGIPFSQDERHDRGPLWDNSGSASRSRNRVPSRTSAVSTAGGRSPFRPERFRDPRLGSGLLDRDQPMSWIEAVPRPGPPRASEPGRWASPLGCPTVGQRCYTDSRDRRPAPDSRSASSSVTGHNERAHSPFGSLLWSRSASRRESTNEDPQEPYVNWDVRVTRIRPRSGYETSSSLTARYLFFKRGRNSRSSVYCYLIF